MTIPAEAIQAAAEAISRELMSGKDYSMAIDSDEALAQAALEAAVPLLRAEGAAAERDRLHPLLAAYHALYDAYWNKTATVDIEMDGYNGLSYDDTNLLDEAAGAVEEVLAAGEFADLLDAP